MELSLDGHLKKLMVDNLGDFALILLDTEGKVLSWNAGAKNVLGYEAADAVGQPYARILPSEARDANGVPLSLTLARRNGRHEEIAQRTDCNGKDRELREIVFPLRDSERNLVAYGLVMQSLTAARPAAGATGPGTATADCAPIPKVLLVDDDDQVRMTAEYVLKDLDYEVVSVASGAEALDVLRHDESIDVLFTDVIMPGMDGGELAEQARLLRPDLKILFTSGYFEHALIQKGSIRPNTNLLVKPYRSRDLAKKMKLMLAPEVCGSDHLPLDAA